MATTQTTPVQAVVLGNPSVVRPARLRSLPDGAIMEAARPAGREAATASRSLRTRGQSMVQADVRASERVRVYSALIRAAQSGIAVNAAELHREFHLTVHRATVRRWVKELQDSVSRDVARGGREPDKEAVPSHTSVEELVERLEGRLVAVVQAEVRAALLSAVFPGSGCVPCCQRARCPHVDDDSRSLGGASGLGPR